MRDAVIFLQDMPFWYEKFPDLRLWKIPALAPFWTVENPVLVQWMNLQRAFVDAMEQQRIALARPFSGSLTNVRAELVNAYLAQLVRAVFDNLPIQAMRACLQICVVHILMSAVFM